MATASHECDVIVVGAGPVGLMLAGELALAGVTVTVVEERTEPTTESRASTLHARTMEILDMRGLLTPLEGAPRQGAGHFGGIPMDLSGDSPLCGQWKVAQARTEELLAHRARRLGARIERGHRLAGWTTHTHAGAAASEADGGWVKARTHSAGGPRTWMGRYLVACDGQESTVRTRSGAAFPGHSARRELLRADVTGIAIPDRRFQRLPRGLAIAATREGVTRVMVHAFGSPPPARTQDPDFSEIAQAWKHVTGEDLTSGTPLWANSFGDANRQLEHYRSGRILFAGDAAHQQMPIGGQALNLGVQDAFNLGWKLAAHLRHGAGDHLLDSYSHERRTVGARVLANIEAQALLLLGDPDIEPVRETLAALLALEPVRARLAGMISGLDIHYTPTPAAAGQSAPEGAHPLVGSRLPPHAAQPLPGAQDTTTAAALQHSGRGLLLHLHPDGRPPRRHPLPPPGWAQRVDAAALRPRPDGPLAGLARVLVRPDGYLAWAQAAPAPGTEAPAGARAADDDRLQDALGYWFGPPR
ncbi:FAD-dependent monooxygenase [Streptomyces sp. N2-109]|uniref:FAD-dependent monooxygenase n=1 Tax=Streptomyces gossypii TaxID=2883101 RepID=A0ABT2JKQ6_9ACTN|nr:FAD-dependent monooxygenase [Streptomyces gossypii]MCT2588457.1 FAD-dependent monooxygenase [Streptomyces gossypii]